MRKPEHGWVSWLVLAGLVILLIVVWNKRLSIYDWWRLHGYSPPPAIAELATQTTMTPKAVHDFYVNRPKLEAGAAINSECPPGSEQTIVLGCYQSDQRGIFIYSVTDSRLNGVEQVTAAHEMLHAAYDRLSSQERNYVDGLLEDYYQHDLHDQRILSTMAAYQKSEPKAVVNEMHSVFGTEVMNLPPALEAYYKRYFTNRQVVAGYAAAYQNEFTSRQNQVAADDTQLKQMKTTIDNDESDLASQLTALDATRSKLDAERAAGQVDSYNAAVPGFNDRINSYNQSVASLQLLIGQYNELVSQRNTIALQESQLQQALNSRMTPLAAQ